MMLLIGLVSGFVICKTITDQPKNIRVWAVEDTVKIPTGLQSYLESNHKNDCKSWRGTDTPTGVALFAVEKSVGDQYALMTYGCSDQLNPGTTIVAAKVNGKWIITQPVEYYSGKDKLPSCSQIDKYQISKNAEPKCVDSKGSTKENTN